MISLLMHASLLTIMEEFFAADSTKHRHFCGHLLMFGIGMELEHSDQEPNRLYGLF